VAAASVAILPQPIQTGIVNNWVRVRPSFFRGLAKTLQYAEDKLFGLILDCTIGHCRTWEKITPARFCQVAGVTRRRCEQALSALLGTLDPETGVYLDGLIRRRKSSTGAGHEYAIAARPALEASSIARCRGCGETSEIELDVEFIPVPHSFFISLPAACDRGMYLVVKCIVERTMRWDKTTKQIVVIPCAVTVEEFERATGLKRAEIIEDLSKVQKLGFIGCQKVGRANVYWAKPENFAGAPARGKRECKQPKREKSTREKQTSSVETAEVTPSIRPVEFVISHCGVCRHCGCYGPVDLIEPEAKPRKPAERARPAPKVDRNEAAWDVLREWYKPDSEKTVLKA
jgi:hypothetical protein